MQKPVIIVSYMGSAPDRITGGTGARTKYIFKALSYHNHESVLLYLCIDCNAYSVSRNKNKTVILVPIKLLHIHTLNFESIDNKLILLKTIKVLQNYLELEI